MSYDRRRAALLVCCVLGVVVAGSFFPAAGYGDYPDAEAVDESYYEAGGDGGAERTAADDGGDPGGSDSRSTTDEGSPTEAGGDADTETATADETERDRSPTATETSTEPDPGGGAGASGPPVHPGLVLATGIGCVGALAWYLSSPDRAKRRGYVRGEVPTGFLPRLRLRLALIPQLTMAGAIAASRAISSLVDALAGASRGVTDGLGAVGSDLGRGLGTALVTVPGALVGALSALRPPSLSGGFAALLDAAGGAPRPGKPGSERRRSGRSGGPDDASRREPDPPETVEEAWADLVDDLPVRRRQTRTPGELARIAVDRGLPSRPVATLTTLFREVRYGGASATPERTTSALEAYERIERTREADGGDGADGDDRSGGESRTR